METGEAGSGERGSAGGRGDKREGFLADHAGEVEGVAGWIEEAVTRGLSVDPVVDGEAVEPHKNTLPVFVDRREGQEERDPSAEDICGERARAARPGGGPQWDEGERGERGFGRDAQTDRDAGRDGEAR